MSFKSSQSVSFNLIERSDLPRKEFAAGERIVEAGDAAHEMFLVHEGRVEIRVGDTVVEIIEKGGIFGEMALIDHSKRSADAYAVEPTTIIPIDERLFTILVQDTPFFALDVMRILAERLRAMDEKIAGH